MKIYQKILGMFLAVLLVGNLSGASGYYREAAAASVKVNCSCSMYVSDGKMYFSVRTKGLFCYDLTDGNIKRLRSTKSGNASETVGFPWFTIKGNYIYFDWNQICNSDENNYFVYRISKDGKNLKKLAKGYNSLVSGNRIYYQRLIADPEYIGQDYGDGFGSMKLDGTGKKKIKEPKFSVLSNSPDERAGEKGIKKPADSGNYHYYMEDGSLMCKNKKTGSIQTTFKLADGDKLWSYCVHTKHALVVVQNPPEEEYDDYVRLTYYYVRNNGKGLKKLKHFAIDESWW